MLPSPELLRLSLDKVFLALQDMVQVELIRTMYEEIRKLQLSKSSIQISF
jgi:hypothetical protein